jgi:flagellar biosynthesis/type III secretory pathway chaperone
VDDLFSSLNDVMQQELIAYKDMLLKARQKKETLLKNDVAMLDRIVAHEWRVLKSIRQLETDREDLIRRIAQARGLDSRTITLAQIADMLDGEPRNRLMALKEELTAVMAEISSLNLANKGLVDTHLQYSTFCINLLTGSVNTLNTYSYSGRISDAQERSTLVLDRTV